MLGWKKLVNYLLLGTTRLPKNSYITVESGGTVRVLSGGTLDAQAGSTVNIGGVPAVSPVTVLYTSVTPTEGAFIADRAYLVNSIYVRPQSLATTAATFVFWKAGDGVGMASGTQLSTGSIDLLTATASVNKVVNLTATVASLTLATGDALGYVVSGTLTAARGSITFSLKPV